MNKKIIDMWADPRPEELTKLRKILKELTEEHALLRYPFARALGISPITLEKLMSGEPIRGGTYRKIQKGLKSRALEKLLEVEEDD